MSSTGQQIQSWNEAIDEVFGHALRPLPNIETEQTHSTFGSFTFQNGEVKKVDVQFRIDRRRTKTITVQLFYKKASCFGKRCMFPGCTTTKHEWLHSFRHWLTSNTATANNKRYICVKHMIKLKAHLKMLCRSIGVQVNCSARESDYTNFIELCKVLHKPSKCSTQVLQDVFGDNPENIRAVRELLINVENYLVIVNLLIDIQGDLLSTMLPFVIDMTVFTLKTATTSQPIQEQVELIDSIIRETLYFFGVIYHWESVNDTGNPYSQLGAGIGGMLGVLSSIVSGNILLGVVYSDILGGIGCRIGNSYYNDIRNRQLMEQSLMNYQDFRQAHQEYERLTATAVVVVLLAVLVAVQVMHILVN